MGTGRRKGRGGLGGTSSTGGAREIWDHGAGEGEEGVDADREHSHRGGRRAREKPRGHTKRTVNDNGDERTRMVSNTRSSNVIDEECEAAARGNKFFGVPGLRSPSGLIYPFAGNANQLWP